MEYPFSHYGHSGPVPPSRVPAPARADMPAFHRPDPPVRGTFGFREGYSLFLGRLRSSRRAVHIIWVGTDRITVSRHFHSGSFARETTRFRVFAFDFAGASLNGLGRM